LIAAEIANLAHGGDRKTDTFKSGHPISKTRAEAARLADSAPEAISQVRLIREWAPEEIPAMQAGRQNLEEAYRRAQAKKYEAEGQAAPKPKKQRKQKKAPPVQVAVPPASELSTLQQRAEIFLSWIRDLRDHPELYDGAAFADFTEQSDEETFEAVRKFYRAFFTRFRERFPQSISES
jgi:hypothetical protein